ncbi:MAG: 30S ribosomal protein S8e [Methanobacteriota archaeon]
MVKWQGRSLKKPSGGRIWASRKKRKREMGSAFIEPKIGQVKCIRIRTFGGGRKMNMLHTDIANVMDPKTGRAKKAKIIKVVQNPADFHFVRRNILTRGAIIDTELGKAKITSRPGQVGAVDALLIEPKTGTNPTSS